MAASSMKALFSVSGALVVAISSVHQCDAQIVGYPSGACSPVVRTCVSHVPQTSYHTVWRQVPVTTYRPVTSFDPCTGYWVTQYQPVTTVQWRQQQQSVTSYRPLFENGTDGTSALLGDFTQSYADPLMRAPTTYRSGGTTSQQYSAQSEVSRRFDRLEDMVFQMNRQLGELEGRLSGRADTQGR